MNIRMEIRKRPTGRQLASASNQAATTAASKPPASSQQATSHRQQAASRPPAAASQRQGDSEGRASGLGLSAKTKPKKVYRYMMTRARKINQTYQKWYYAYHRNYYIINTRYNVTPQTMVIARVGKHGTARSKDGPIAV